MKAHKLKAILKDCYPNLVGHCWQVVTDDGIILFSGWDKEPLEIAHEAMSGGVILTHEEARKLVSGDTEVLQELSLLVSK